MSDELLIHGTSDDILEVSGRISQQFPTRPGVGEVDVAITRDGEVTQFVVSMAFGDQDRWTIAVWGRALSDSPILVEFQKIQNWWSDVAVKFTLLPDDDVSVTLRQ